jgi:hypothetical protein
VPKLFCVVFVEIIQLCLTKKILSLRQMEFSNSVSTKKRSRPATRTFLQIIGKRTRTNTPQRIRICENVILQQRIKGSKDPKERKPTNSAAILPASQTEKSLVEFREQNSNPQLWRQSMMPF